MPQIEPGPETQRALREALGRFATGVTVVTANSDIGPLGITANSFASVSLDPPLLLWCPAKKSRRFKAFSEARHFAVHVMAHEQAHVAEGFTRNGDAFDMVTYSLNAHGVPLIDNCLARFECTTEATHDAGDHSIVVARITHVEWRDGAPLVFSQGQLGAFTVEMIPDQRPS